MKQRRIPEWVAEFELLQAQEIFDDFDALAHEEVLRAERAERYRLKRERNMLKALRIRPRLYKVQDFDIWKANEHIEREDDWGDTRPKINAVKATYEKKARLQWILSNLFNYWAFDYVQGQSFKPNKRTLTFSYLAKTYDRLLAELKEKARDERIDRDRAKWRATKEKRDATLKAKKSKPFSNRVKSRISEVFTLRYGVSGPEILVKGANRPIVSEKALAQEFNADSIRTWTE